MSAVPESKPTVLPDAYFSAERDDFLSLSDSSLGPEFRKENYPQRHYFAQSRQELLQHRAAVERRATLPPPIPSGVYYSLESDNFYGVLRKGCGTEFYSLWHQRSSEFPQSHDALMQFADQAAYAPQILKGVGRVDGDGWKDVTRKGETVYVWNSPLPPPNAPHQYPRVLHPGWAASVEQYDFSPATVEEVRSLFLSAGVGL